MSGVFGAVHLQYNQSNQSSAYQSVELRESPKPGVSTTVSRNLTPRSSISTVDASIFTVCCIFSVKYNHKNTNVKIIY